MSLPHAILTALLEKPSSGLELTRRFDRSIGFFWRATHQQIYRELGKLEAAGHIHALPQTAPTRGSRKEYEVLPAGRGELARWTGGGDDPRPLRDALSLRLRAAAVVGTDGLAAEIERHLALHREQLAAYRAFEERDLASSAPPERQREDSDEDATRQRVLHHLLLRGGIQMETFHIDWLTEALEAVRSLEAAQAGQPDERPTSTDSV